MLVGVTAPSYVMVYEMDGDAQVVQLPRIWYVARYC